MKSIWAQTLVKNEERYLWYAVNSVIDYVDRLLLWDTGSTDKTIQIAKEIERRYPRKVNFREVGEVDAEGFTKVRQKMLDETDADWFLVLDGDEVWWEGSIKEVIGEIKDGNIDAIVSPYINLIGDSYHYQEEKAGRYQIDQKIGNITIRAFSRRIPGLHVKNPYGLEGYYDKAGKAIQESLDVKRKFIDAPYLHFTHLRRSGKDKGVMGRAGKVKYELGMPIPLDFYYPEVFFRARLNLVPSPWERRDTNFLIRAAIETPFRKIKRRIWQARVGY
jgi:glycosyltransferase involved in cell wall biosynthesis